MYSVPIVPADLRHEETIIQAANSLDYLQKTIADVFDRIDARIEKNHVKINDLKCRIDTAHQNINSLVGINKAIKIFSPAKFPASHIFTDIPKTFDDLKYSPTFRLDEDYEVRSSLDPVSHRNIEEKLAFYHVRTNLQGQKTISGRIMEQKQGLGKMPANMQSVNGLLRFNTNENVYRKGGLVEDTLGKSSATRKKEKSSPIGQKIEAPPMSMLNRNIGEKKPNSGLFYSPKLNDAPELDVPMDLPDLPGIADDITFSLNENERIAPSFYIDNLPDLPEPENITASVSATETETKIEVPPPPPPLQQPPPPPQPPIEVNQTHPPPPPPPPMPSASPSRPSTSSTPATPIVEMTDARMNLMEAIRKTGGLRGAKLKTAAAAEVSKSSETGSKKAETKPSGDLMADLHNKLLMRRKGISGAKEQDAGGTSSGAGNGSVMDRLSALIPPPPPKTGPVATNSASDENDEWTD